MATSIACLPFAPLIALPPVAVAGAGVLAVLFSAPGLGAPLVRAGLIRTPEIVTVVSTFLAIAVAGGVAWAGLARGTGGGVAARLARAPWRARQAASKAGDAVCPFTGQDVACWRGGSAAAAAGRPLPPRPSSGNRAAKRCPACSACVAPAAWHPGHKLAGKGPGSGALLWELAGKALAEVREITKEEEIKKAKD
jgi:hypothetical protein